MAKGRRVVSLENQTPKVLVSLANNLEPDFKRK
nr:MAG TPA: hypothetical protein [Caudoviricetes sp.]